MESHLRFAGLAEAVQRAELDRIVRSSPLLMEVLAALRDDALPDHLLVAGAIYNLVWNRLTGGPDLAGINDIDVFYFDGTDLSYEAEDLVIQRFATRFAHLPLPVQIRNQARVHLWFESKFGSPFTPLTSSAEMLAATPAGPTPSLHGSNPTIRWPSSPPSASTTSSRCASHRTLCWPTRLPTTRRPHAPGQSGPSLQSCRGPRSHSRLPL